MNMDFLLRLPFEIRFKEKVINFIQIQEISNDVYKDLRLVEAEGVSELKTRH